MGSFEDFGISRRELMNIFDSLEERAKNRVPNEKFKTVGKVVELMKEIADENEGKLSVEYWIDGVSISIEAEMISFIGDKLEPLKKVLDYIDTLDFYIVDCDKIKISAEINKVFDI